MKAPMSSLHSHEIFADLPLMTMHQAMPDEAGRKCRGKLWSNFMEVCDLLQIPFSISIAGKGLLFQHVQFRPGQRIHTVGQKFVSLYIINSGFLKTTSIDDLGYEQVLDFPMKGDVLGANSISTKRYSSETVALSDCNIIMLPFHNLLALSHAHVELENLVCDIFGRELLRKQAMLDMLSAPNAEAKVARFLISLSERYFEIGYSKTEFMLRMARKEIGNYLGLSLETVSRTLSALNEAGLISVDQRAIWIKEPDMLKQLSRIPSYGLQARQVRPRKLQVGAAWSQPAPGLLVN
jgi:CRP/FNR family transcriptional regulator